MQQVQRIPFSTRFNLLTDIQSIQTTGPHTFEQSRRDPTNFSVLSSRCCESAVIANT